MAEEPQGRITYRREWRWLPWPHRETIGVFSPGEGGPLTGPEILQMARDLTPAGDDRDRIQDAIERAGIPPHLRPGRKEMTDEKVLFPAKPPERDEDG